MTSETIQMERFYPAGHRNRHMPRLCPECGAPLTARGACTRGPQRSRSEPLNERFPDPRARLERMERMARR